MWCALVENKVICSFFFEECKVACDTFLATFHHVPVGMVFQLDGALPHSSHHVPGQAIP
jgi:hypothetical protein